MYLCRCVCARGYVEATTLVAVPQESSSLMRQTLSGLTPHQISQDDCLADPKDLSIFIPSTGLISVTYAQSTLCHLKSGPQACKAKLSSQPMTLAFSFTTCPQFFMCATQMFISVYSMQMFISV